MAANKCTGVLVTYECLEDSDSWGKRGSKNQIFFPSEDYSYEKSKTYAPSNWAILYTDDADRDENGHVSIRGLPR